MIRVRDLVNRLCAEFVELPNKDDSEPDSLYPNNWDELGLQGRREGWLEEEDTLYPDFGIDRRAAARIIHQFIKIKLGIADVSDWSRAKKCADLYDCRVCAAHIAQVVERYIFLPKYENRFGLLDKVTEEELSFAIERIKYYNK